MTNDQTKFINLRNHTIWTNLFHTNVIINQLFLLLWRLFDTTITNSYFCSWLLLDKIIRHNKLYSTIIKTIYITNRIASNNKSSTYCTVRKLKLYFFIVLRFNINLFRLHPPAQKNDCFNWFCLNNFHHSLSTRTKDWIWISS